MDRPTSLPPGTEPLGSADCLDHLVGSRIGYLATTDRALPVIVPVAITTDPGCLLLAPLFTARIGEHPDSARSDAVVALAVGDVEGEDTWCVVAQGILQGVPAGSGTHRRRFHPAVVAGWRRSATPA